MIKKMIFALFIIECILLTVVGLVIFNFHTIMKTIRAQHASTKPLTITKTMTVVWKANPKEQSTMVVIDEGDRMIVKFQEDLEDICIYKG